MVICPQCQFANPEGMSLCLQCGQGCGIAELAERGSKLVGVSDCTPVPETNDASSPIADAVAAVASAAPEGVSSGTGMVLPSLGQAQASALTIRNRTSTSRQALTPPPDHSGTSEPASGVTRVTLKPEAKRSGMFSAPTRPDTPATDAPANKPEPPKAAVPKLLVLRGEKLNYTYPIYEGKNVVGRFADKPVDIDLEGQEVMERIRVSRHHAIIHFDSAKNELRIEDLNSLNGTWVNNVKIHSGHMRRLAANDVVQIGTVQLKVLIEMPGS